ncbi:hypothetical protein CVT24_001594 [Panaeolus cyanescens]|uniref:NAD(P)-binding protein n=1 Tax=Panaeolus cyanescens TaxID=181874 RepID=A0A409YFE5_9AGAR|nr:hypothetical protein CVT24_001594 [Panaeolus cyanescens]
MTSIPDDKLFEHSDRVKGKVLLITGAANGIGKEAALKFASYGARVVIGDIDLAGAQKVVREIEGSGGSAAAIRCDVTDFDQQVELFELAYNKFGSVDIVVPNAGITEVPGFTRPTLKNGKPVKPSLKTIEINLNGLLYTSHLALHYMRLNQKTGDLKSLVLLGSVASWMGIPLGTLYTASKHGVLGVMRSLHEILHLQGIRVACIHPFFADTAIVPIPVKLALAGIPLTPVSRVAGAIFLAATDTDPKTNGAAWLLLDDGPVFIVPKEEFKQGVYGMIDARANAARGAVVGIKAWVLFFADIWRIVGKPAAKVGIAATIAHYAWKNKETIEGFVRPLLK